MSEQKEEQKTKQETSPYKKTFEAEITMKIQLSDEEINKRKREIFEELEELLAKEHHQASRALKTERILFEKGKIPIILYSALPEEIPFSYYDNLTKHTVYLGFDELHIYVIEHILEYGMSLPPIQKLTCKLTIYGFYP